MNNRPVDRLTQVAATVVIAACGEESVAPPSGSGLAISAMAFADHSPWSEPVHIGPPINSPARELGARLSPDELSLYFGSDRPGGLGAFDIWVSRRSCLDCPWEAPANLGPNINSPPGPAGEGDGGPALSHDGLLLFFSGARAGGEGHEDIWVARRTDPNDDLSWGPAVNLGAAVNTALQENGPSYVPALAGGAASLFFSRGGDIYEARVMRDGEVLGTAVPVAELNHPTAFDSEVQVRADGREVFFWSTRPGGMGAADIWVSTRRSPHDPWSAPQPVGAPVGTQFAELTPGLSWDGRTLLFAGAAARGGSLGFQDIWMSTRTSSGN